ncbi:MAG: hypothetical protein K8S23_16410 [Candidatus Cloacimonetes bacterium]|nr:hypothetical protein [Candidatus Cloacimonadota bacterium]
MRKYIFYFSIFFSILFWGCSIKYIPLKTEKISVSNDYAILKTENYNIVVQYRYWSKEPEELSEYFTTFFATITNKTNDKINIELKDITLLDDNGNQLDPINLDIVENMLLPDEIRFEDIVSSTLEKDQAIDNWREARKNLMIHSFHFGQIFPNAKKSGFLYFNRLPSSNQSCKIIIKDNVFSFERQKKK